MGLLNDRTSKTLGWVAITTYISQRWGNIALQYAALWSNLAFDISQPLDTFLGRSKGVLLNVQGQWDDTGDHCFTHVLAALVASRGCR